MLSSNTFPSVASDEDIHAADDLKIAIVGQRNAGKSTLLNADLG
jgi:tRNA U34 5-carboxymethylaminomethyl modifying GTPase MnmE/TrmE